MEPKKKRGSGLWHLEIFGVKIRILVYIATVCLDSGAMEVNVVNAVAGGEEEALKIVP